MKKIFLSLGTTLLCSILLQASNTNDKVEFLLKKTAYHYDFGEKKCVKTNDSTQRVIIEDIVKNKLQYFGGLKNELGETSYLNGKINDENVTVSTMDTFEECRYFEDLEIKHLTNLNPNNYKHIKSYKDKPLDKLVDSSSIINNVKTITFKNFEYKVIISPITGKKWLDRNLGATQVCTSSTDKACYGDYYQWGRLADGHEESTYNINSVQATAITNAGNYFITRGNGGDWTATDIDGNQRIVQWNKIDGSGVCPVGFRVPTKDELDTETVGYTRNNDITKGAVKVENTITALQNFLKFPGAGGHDSFDGSIYRHSEGGVWVNSIDGTGSQYMGFGTGGAGWATCDRAFGRSVRCIEGN